MRIWFWYCFWHSFCKREMILKMLIKMWYFHVKNMREIRKVWKMPVFNNGLHGIIDSACVFSSSFLRIVSRTSNMPFILMLSLWYVKYFQYHHITAWEAGRSERQKSRNVFHLTKCLFLVMDFAHFHLTYAKFALLKDTI